MASDDIHYFSCTSWKLKAGDNYALYCFAEDSLQVFSIVLLCFLIYLSVVYIKFVKIAKNDLRHVILILAELSCVNTFIHYTFLDGE